MKASIDQLQSSHVAAGLGRANREFLSVCLGVFDDSTLLKRVEGALRNTLDKTPIRKLVSRVESSARKWELNEKLTDDHLRALLWIKLQRALDVCPRITQSTRGCERLVDDLVAAGLQVVDSEASGGRFNQIVRRAKNQKANHTPTNTLAALVEPLLSRMLKQAMGEDECGMDEVSRQRLVSDIIDGLGEEERREILSRVSEEDIDSAVKKLLATGGVHGAFAASVAGTGFAPYILAAQASAFIPFVSGPALVSFVSVLANPVFFVVVASGLGWYWNRKANKKAAAQVAVHLIALLACDGLRRQKEAVDNLVASFDRIRELPRDAFTDREEESTYKSLWHEMEANSWLSHPRDRVALADQWERQDLFRDSVAIGAISIGDLLYSLAAVDPNVVAAADFARSDEISNPVDFALNLLNQFKDPWGARKTPTAQRGDLAQLKGYTMEQLAAANLSKDGHVVQVADDSNQPGWDLIVDGQKFQVKCLADSSLLNEHFERYPDIPVLANSDLADEAETWPDEWRDSVFFLEGHTDELVGEVVARSYAEAKDLGDNDVPEIAVAYVAARHLWSLKKGEVTGTQATSQILLEGGTRAGLAVVGSVVGQAVGLVLFGPAGALIGGGVSPIVAQAGAPQLVGRVKDAFGLRSKKETEVDDECRALCLTVEQAIDDKLAMLRLKHRQVGDGPAGAYVRSRLRDEARHLDECQGYLLRLRQEGENRPDRALEILRTAVRAVHPARYQLELRRLLQAGNH